MFGDHGEGSLRGVDRYRGDGWVNHGLTPHTKGARQPADSSASDRQGTISTDHEQFTAEPARCQASGVANLSRSSRDHTVTVERPIRTRCSGARPWARAHAANSRGSTPAR